MQVDTLIEILEVLDERPNFLQKDSELPSVHLKTLSKGKARLFVSGEMTGKPDFNRAKFEEMKSALLEFDVEVVLPFDTTNNDLTLDWISCMSRTVLALKDCHGMVVLDECDSAGCRIEEIVCSRVGIPYGQFDWWKNTCKLAKLLEESDQETKDQLKAELRAIGKTM